jgi:hypothetical protein
MDCRQAQSSLADLSAEQLPSSSVSELHSHLEHCPECHREWQLFQVMLITLSSSTQALPSQQQSEEMWNACLQKWMEQVEEQRAAQRSSLWDWVRRQPRWGWAALGGAVAVFGGIWMFSPHDDPSELPPTPPGVTWIRFDTPPAIASSLVNHHSAMAFDPFTDHVGSTLVSYSATAPAPLEPSTLAPSSLAPASVAPAP